MTLVLSVWFLFKSPNHVIAIRSAHAATANFIAAAPGWVDVKGGIRQLIAQTHGAVKQVYVKDGDKIDAGAVLVQLDNQEAMILLQAAQIEQQRRRQEWIMLVNQLHQAQATTERLVPLVAQQAEPADLLRQARQRVNELQAQVILAQLDEQAAAKQQALADNKLMRMQIRAPISGSILRMKVHPGDGVEPGRLMLTLIPQGPQIIRAELDERLFGLVKPGMMAEVAPEYDERKLYRARVVRIARAVGPVDELMEIRPAARDDRVVECELELEEKADFLLGQRVLVRIRGPS